jgi:hypothetical protein
MLRFAVARPYRVALGPPPTPQGCDNSADDVGLLLARALCLGKTSTSCADDLRLSRTMRRLAFRPGALRHELKRRGMSSALNIAVVAQRCGLSSALPHELTRMRRRVPRIGARPWCSRGSPW